VPQSLPRGLVFGRTRVFGVGSITKSLLRYLKGQHAIAEPARQFSYSNTNYTLLGLIIEAITGRELVAELRPGICRAPGGLLEVSCSNLSVEWAAGGLLASAPALVRFGVGLKTGQLLGARGMQILSARVGRSPQFLPRT